MAKRKVVTWVTDCYGTLNLHFTGPDGQDVWAWIAARPAYCDRGHWEFNVMNGIPDLDGMDSFPRYYMHLETAIKEATDWIFWRLYKKACEIPHTLTQYDDPLLDGIRLTYVLPDGVA